jgi:hypothetical protein
VQDSDIEPMTCDPSVSRYTRATSPTAQGRTKNTAIFVVWNEKNDEF